MKEKSQMSEVRKVAEFLGTKQIKVVAKGASAEAGTKQIIKLVTTPGLIKLEPNDLFTLFKKSKALSLLSASAKGKNAAGLLVKKIGATIKKGALDGCRKLIFNVTGNKAMTLCDVNEIAESIYNLCHPKAKIIFGAKLDKKMRGLEVAVVTG